ncbi:sporulation-delaying protein SdpB family protein [Echinicola soli]|uniref:sporulation-delaying protein SdpB family protein n=1 Tax=Echinicola soli TaxID=2591634 RepID=UPI00143D8BB2|nr:sporulation-delaying protein SdpB family protein [Echinicola soli]
MNPRIEISFYNLIQINPVNTVYGIGRTLLASSTLITLLANSPDVLFPQTIQVVEAPVSPLVGMSLFNLLVDHLVIAKLLAIISLITVIIGIYPRYTGILHWYVAFSFFSACKVIDGGDHANSVLTLMIVPLTLLDNRKWHWKSPKQETNPPILQNTIAWSFVMLIRVQVSIIYLHAAVGKTGVKEWLDGTAVYYWFTHHYHGAAEWLKPIVVRTTSLPYIVTTISWGTIVLEFLLFACLFLSPKDPRRKIFLVLGIGFHLAIVLVHGLVSFYLVMCAALVLYLSNYSSAYIFLENKSLKTWILSRLS